MNYVPFAEGVVRLVVELYRATATHTAVIHQHVLHAVIKVITGTLLVKSHLYTITPFGKLFG